MSTWARAAGRLATVYLAAGVAVVATLELIRLARLHADTAELRARSFWAACREYAEAERRLASDAAHVVFEAYIATRDAAEEEPDT